MIATAPDLATCGRCGARLSRYRDPDEPEGLCAPCGRSRASEPLEALPAPPARILEAEDLVLAVAGLLTLRAGVAPGDRVHVQGELERLGILADHLDVHQAVAKLRRRYGWHVAATEGHAGYELRAWPYRFTRRPRRGQLELF